MKKLKQNKYGKILQKGRTPKSKALKTLKKKVKYPSGNDPRWNENAQDAGDPLWENERDN